MKKIIRSTNDLLLAVLIGGLSIFLLLSKKIITGVENGLGGMWAQASTYIHLLAGALTGCGSTGSSSAQEVIDYVNANPGKVTVGCTGSNNVNYGTTMELLKDMGIYDKVTIVPYDGVAASETALQGGISSTALMMGLFAITEVFNQSLELHKPRPKIEFKKTTLIPPFSEMKSCWKAIGIGCVIVIGTGILPGIGQNASTLISYNLARTVSKTPQEFGHGCPEGISASETSNNATNGGALIPLVCLGIPGDLTTSALIGGLMIHGLQPGPLLYSQHPELAGGIMVAYFMANVVMYIMELGLMKAFVRMVNVKLSFLFPAIVACCVLGVYTLNNRMFDVWVMIIFGFVGYLLICLGIDMAPVILGFILGPLIEKYMRMALISANGNWADMFNRPVSVFFVVIEILFVVVPVIKKAVTHGKEKA